MSQRVVNVNNPVVRAMLDPQLFVDMKARLRDPLKAAFSKEEDRTLVCSLFDDATTKMRPERTDAVGFAHYCEHSQIAWLKVGYIRWLVQRSGPFPRRQDLHIGGFLIGAPEGRKFVVSYPWASSNHPSPSGMKLVNLLIALINVGACDDDGVFIDYCSLPQADRAVPSEYFRNVGTGMHEQTCRTPAEQRCFRLALAGLNRLYAYEGCEVIVLPDIEPPGRFPVGDDAWGPTSDRPYHKRGWCCCEYTIARFCGRIVNAADPSVQAVERRRVWPETVADYANLMNESNPDQVIFTVKGDVDYVQFLFFKVCVGLENMTEDQCDALVLEA